MLTAADVHRAQAQAKPQKLHDGGGLLLFVSTSGAKSWRFAYRFAGRAQTLTLGRFPTLSLKEARLRHADARKALANGKNPAVLKREEKAQRRAPRPSIVQSAR